MIRRPLRWQICTLLAVAVTPVLNQAVEMSILVAGGTALSTGGDKAVMGSPSPVTAVPCFLNQVNSAILVTGGTALANGGDKAVATADVFESTRPPSPLLLKPAATVIRLAT